MLPKEEPSLPKTAAFASWSQGFNVGSWEADNGQQVCASEGRHGVCDAKDEEKRSRGSATHMDTSSITPDSTVLLMICMGLPTQKCIIKLVSFFRSDLSLSLPQRNALLRNQINYMSHVASPPTHWPASRIECACFPSPSAGAALHLLLPRRQSQRPCYHAQQRIHAARMHNKTSDPPCVFCENEHHPTTARSCSFCKAQEE